MHGFWLHISSRIPFSSRFCLILAFLGDWDGVESVFEVPQVRSHVSRLH
jgi:hypothetical protein